ncbi:MAG: alpha/beta fold hydrolase [Rubrobacteraceae bacterium]
MFEGFGEERIEGRGAGIHLVRGGDGPPLLLLHGYPQTHVMWHEISQRLAADFTVVAPDLRGYGDSSKPAGGPDHAGYSKREMANDQVEVMDRLGFDRFSVAGHDRGGRVAHRMALDHPERVEKLAVLDIAPTHTMYTTADMEFARAYYHWFFLIQPYDLPERLIGADPEYYLRKKLGQWGRDERAITPEAFTEYLRCFSPETIHASCEDYRASASIDLTHDEEDLGHRISCPLLVLWGEKGFVGKKYDVVATWKEKTADVRGRSLPCGHFLPEEAPEQTLEEFRAFFLA